MAVTLAMWLGHHREVLGTMGGGGREHAVERAALAAAALGSGLPTPIEQLLDGAADPEALPGLLGDLCPIHERGALLPAPGDPMGVPAEFTADGGHEGEVLVLTYGRRPTSTADDGGVNTMVLVPRVHEYGSELEPGILVAWEATVLDRRVPIGLDGVGDARREVHRAMDRAIEVLEGLDIARTAPELADALNDVTLAHLHQAVLPPGIDSRRGDLVESAARLLAIVDLALHDEGGATTAAQMATRRAALTPVARAARRALAAASASRDRL